MTFTASPPVNRLKHKAIIWTISGADCSGGAGIAADIKTGHSLSVEVCHLITANTVQNSEQLRAINPTAVDILDAQAQALRFDKPPSVIKVGLIANSKQVIWLATLLKALKQQLANLIVVYDPVGQASVGGNLSSLTPLTLRPLLPLIDVMTPNLLEAKQLSTLSPTTIKHNPLQLAEYIVTLGCKAVIIKGGHAKNSKSSELATHCPDLCLQRLNSTSTQTLELSSPRMVTNYSHGGGCSFASALASFLAHGYLLRDAFTLTKAFINQGLSLSSELANNHNNSQYYGAFEQGSWPTKAEHFPQVISSLTQFRQTPIKFPSLNLAAKEKLGLYPVIDSLEWLERLLPLNLKIVQLRIKDKKIEELAPIIKQAVRLAREYGCRLFINDHWEVAIKCGAYGVHIGQEDLENADLSAIANAGLRLGISTHGCYEFLLAKQLQPSYLAIGAIFPTKTKDMTGQIQGLENLRQILPLSGSVPVVAIGGINQQRLKEVWQTGVSAVAVVTAITEAQDPIAATNNMQASLD
jgi:hydroxymethylpyrimidine kinase/phosphomethylpyrimidine kinase/thiamine-phosphate diphosphorylase